MALLLFPTVQAEVLSLALTIFWDAAPECARTPVGVRSSQKRRDISPAGESCGLSRVCVALFQ